MGGVSMKSAGGRGLSLAPLVFFFGFFFLLSSGAFLRVSGLEANVVTEALEVADAIGEKANERDQKLSQQQVEKLATLGSPFVNTLELGLTMATTPALSSLLPLPDSPQQAISSAVETPTSATLSNIRDIMRPGWGQRENNYSWSMVEFKGKIYVGTLTQRENAISLFLFALATSISSSGAQIWRGSRSRTLLGEEWEWESLVVRGMHSARNFGVRTLYNYEDKLLFGVTANHVDGFEIWRSKNGLDWTAEMRGGFGNSENTSGRAMIVWRGFLWVGVENRDSGASIWRRPIGLPCDKVTEADWKMVHAETYTDPVADKLGPVYQTLFVDNVFWFGNFEEFKGELFTSTNNGAGLAVYRVEMDALNEVSLVKVYQGTPGEDGRAIFHSVVFGDYLVCCTGLVGANLPSTANSVIIYSKDGVEWKRWETRDVDVLGGERGPSYSPALRRFLTTRAYSSRRPPPRPSHTHGLPLSHHSTASPMLIHRRSIEPSLLHSPWPL
eukprot:GHVT01042575.1.p1 GENE.GHVT01042575.1~~GHVT01042575.1.p1  ORF type:complete len:499 (+),score=87.29 GHVT01042575.1:1117-2613(+)